MADNIDRLEIETVEGDLPDFARDRIQSSGFTAIDIETSGLDWQTDKIATVQVLVPYGYVLIIRGVKAGSIANLAALLNDPRPQKIFHHAMFDLRFLRNELRIDACNIACTKIASKILHPERKKHRLSELVQEHTGAALDKSLARSDWFSESLTKEQLDYAAKDVLFLPQLLANLLRELEVLGRVELARDAFEFISTRVELDILGAGDVFTY